MRDVSEACNHDDDRNDVALPAFHVFGRGPLQAAPGGSATSRRRLAAMEKRKPLTPEQRELANASSRKYRRTHPTTDAQRERNKIRMRIRYAADPQRARAQRRKWKLAHHEWSAEQQRQWRRDHPGYNTAASNKWHLAHREQYLANKQLQYAVVSGAIVRGPCEACGTHPAEGHHDDYARPLAVRWLCKRHHAELHRLRRTAWAQKQYRVTRICTQANT